MRVLCFLLVLLLCSFAARAQDVFEPHFAFSNYYGSGIYQTKGSDITIFNVPMVFEPDWGEELKHLQDVRLRIPASFGLSNFKYDQAGDTRLDQDAATISLGLGLEKDYWDSEHLKFVPFADVGYAEDLSSHSGALIFALGSSVFRYVDVFDEQQILFGKIQYAGFSTNSSVSENFSSVQLGFDFKYPERFTVGPLSTYLSFYATSYYFAVGFDFEENQTLVLQDELVHEIGFTWGLDEPIETAVADIERIGLGYRFSTFGEGVAHIAFNFPLD